MIPVLKTNLMRKAQENLEKSAHHCEDAMTLSDSCSLPNERANLIHARKAQTSHVRSESAAIFGIGLRNNSLEPDFTRRSSYLRKKRSLSTSQRPLSYIKSLLIIYSDENSKREQSWFCFLTVKRLTQVYYFSK